MLILLAACSSTAPLSPPSKDWPLGEPQQPLRLPAIMNDTDDPLIWWEANILSLVPGEVYPDLDIARETGRLVAATNQKRSAAGLDPVAVLPALNRVAEAHAMDQAIRDYWNHMTPEGLGSRDRIKAAGVGTVLFGGENSAVARPGLTTVEKVVENFSVHEGHRDLLYDPNVKYIGVGIFNYLPSEHVHYVQLLVSF